MKKIINTFISLVAALIFVAPLAAAPVVLAEGTSGSTSGSSHETTTTKTESETETNTSNETELKSRIAEYKLKHAIKFGDGEEVKIKGVCVAAQKKVKSLSQRSTKANTTRGKAYTFVSTKLDNIVPRLKLAGVDTTELEAEQVELDKLITTYNTDYTTFKTDLADLASLDCKTDPAAFKAALEAARADRLVVVKDATAIRTYVVSKIKVSLKAAIKSIETKEAADTAEPETKTDKTEAN